MSGVDYQIMDRPLSEVEKNNKNYQTVQNQLKELDTYFTEKLKEIIGSMPSSDKKGICELVGLGLTVGVEIDIVANYVNDVTSWTPFIDKDTLRIRKSIRYAEILQKLN